MTRARALRKRSRPGGSACFVTCRDTAWPPPGPPLAPRRCGAGHSQGCRAECASQAFLVEKGERGRRVVLAAFVGPIKVTPLDLPERRRFKLEEQARVGKLLATEVSNVASPAGATLDLVNDSERKPALYLCDAGELNPQRKRTRKATKREGEE